MVAGINKKLVVISAVNLVEGGTLTVLRECIEAAERNLSQEWKILVLVNNKSLLSSVRAKTVVIDKPKKSWFARLYYEYIVFYFLSKRLKANLWLSLHDVSPTVHARKRAVYCHNPSPFYNYPLKSFSLSPSLWVFNKFYKYLYRLNIHKNDLVVVQQSWIRKEFVKMFGELPIVVAYPQLDFKVLSGVPKMAEAKNIFFYPAIPRVFKNIELICEAANILCARGLQDFEVRLTFSGDENAYSKKIFNLYNSNSKIMFIGYQDKESMGREYANAKAVVLPSKLETWGLPISEAKSQNKQLLVADLAYAKETVGNYDKVTFFDVNDAQVLAGHMEAIIENVMHHQGGAVEKPQQPFAESWVELWEMLVRDC